MRRHTLTVLWGLGACSGGTEAKHDHGGLALQDHSHVGDYAASDHDHATSSHTHDGEYIPSSAGVATAEDYELSTVRTAHFDVPGSAFIETSASFPHFRDEFSVRTDPPYIPFQGAVPLNLPDGATLDSLTVFYMDADDIVDRGFWCTIDRQPVVGGTITNDEEVADVLANSTGDSFDVHAVSGPPNAGLEIIDQGSYRYVLSARMDSGNASSNVAHHGCRVTYQYQALGH